MNAALLWRRYKKSIAQAEKIIGLGLKKSQLVRQQSITQIYYQRISKKLGNQSMVLVLDVKKNYLETNIPFTLITEVDTHIDPIEFCKIRRF